ncbi:coenzyme F420-reducing hydrogenase%2C beta subunit [Clostridium paraputrificum]|uniref:Coenzyme F420 hydrogenase/dehydrogenase, beta subunit C-terminal domain n=1 Tax=Clostridium paraputrificum TaxID=29363 RepID=UPI0006C091FB|nr:Coenzyme F420 hydrogenase/dehydrogenase, beta subunit C-terminal domain [Clostridium paraputrificum]CUQ42660.1 coenzyme F420-reducing hydrogenase%2C beta subunit [Clostridium paraputrificum]
MIDKIITEKNCTGCTACVNICPKNCISMIEDKEGFLQPKVDYDKCIKCRMCERTCPVLNGFKAKENHKPEVYAAWSLNEEIRINSTSGGIFSELAKYVLNQGGVVFGARYNENNNIEHHMIDRIEEIPILRQSKYAQSNKKNSYKEAKKKLLEDCLVLFCGAPCEIGGLLSYLNKPYENLITCDFVCRGTNSPKVYRKYLDYMEKKYDSKIAKVWFKNKTYGWNRFSTQLEFANGKKYIKDRYNDIFMRGYIEKDLYMRLCCEECKFKEIPRNADISLADFWGIGSVKKELDEDKGTSLVMLNSSKGLELFEKIVDNIYYEKSSFEVGVKGNPCIVKSAGMSEKRNAFFKDIDKYEFDVLLKKYINDSLKVRMHRFLSRTKCKIKYIIKK